MARLNGKVMIPGIIIVAIVTGFIGYGEFLGRTRINAESIKEVKAEVRAVEKVHKDDVKGLDKKLDTLIELVHKQAVTQGRIQTSIGYIQRDIKEIKENGR